MIKIINLLRTVLIFKDIVNIKMVFCDMGEVT